MFIVCFGVLFIISSFRIRSAISYFHNFVYFIIFYFFAYSSLSLPIFFNITLIFILHNLRLSICSWSASNLILFGFLFFALRLFFITINYMVAWIIFIFFLWSLFHNITFITSSEFFQLVFFTLTLYSFKFLRLRVSRINPMLKNRLSNRIVRPICINSFEIFIIVFIIL